MQNRFTTYVLKNLTDSVPSESAGLPDEALGEALRNLRDLHHATCVESDRA